MRYVKQVSLCVMAVCRRVRNVFCFKAAEHLPMEGKSFTITIDPKSMILKPLELDCLRP